MISMWSEMLFDELGGSLMISLMLWILTVCFGAEQAVLGEGKLTLLDLGMNKEGSLIDLARADPSCLQTDTCTLIDLEVMSMSVDSRVELPYRLM
ncbi:hypothetical protein TIFTF001_015259 [Ficus carica]|uniref:Uncharacterized protein n=1 Tax=Ficus carica TaxID=3494 RepID=A0AA88A7I0_FICCA|nr:hypothetical protein TIFTF001_015259 [Ficus carica]